jgi:hypothetical protein
MADIYRNVRTRGKNVWGEESWDKGKSWIRFSADKNLMKIREGIEEHPQAFNEIWKIMSKRYGLKEFDWSFIRDEEDNKIIKRYLKIVSKYHKGKYAWETAKKKLKGMI